MTDETEPTQHTRLTASLAVAISYLLAKGARLEIGNATYPENLDWEADPLNALTSENLEAFLAGEFSGSENLPGMVETTHQVGVKNFLPVLAEYFENLYPELFSKRIPVWNLQY